MYHAWRDSLICVAFALLSFALLASVVVVVTAVMTRTSQFWIRCTGRYRGILFGAWRIDLPTEPRTTAMADPLTPPAQGSAEKPGARSVSSRSDKRSVAKALVSLQVGFYNIGWTDSQLSGQNHEMHRKQLGRDCARAFEFNDLGMLCLCEVGTNKLDENLHAHLGNSAGFQDKHGGQSVNRWLEQVIHECCKTSIDLQAYVLGRYAIFSTKAFAASRLLPDSRAPW